MATKSLSKWTLIKKRKVGIGISESEFQVTTALVPDQTTRREISDARSPKQH
jgi:hypothetical protein